MNEANEKHSLWHEKAMAFLVRTRQEMWGRHKEDIQAFLFQYGFSLKFTREMLLGWNRRSRKRDPETWGIAQNLPELKKTKGKLFLPEGIVVPWTRGQIVEKITVACHLENKSPRDLIIPGSLETSMDFGHGETVMVVENVLDGLLLHQEMQDKAKVIIPHDLCVAPDRSAEEIIKNAGNAIIFPDRLKQVRRETWSKYFNFAKVKTCHSKEDILQAANAECS